MSENITAAITGETSNESIHTPAENGGDRWREGDLQRTPDVHVTSSSPHSATPSASSRRVTNEFTMPASRERGIPFYSAAAAAAKGSTSSIGIGGTKRASSAGGSTATASTPLAASNIPQGRTTSSISQSRGTGSAGEFDLPGRLFGQHRQQQPQKNEGSPFAEPRKPATLTALPKTEKTSIPSSWATLSGANRSADGTPIDNESFFADILFMWMGVERTNYMLYDPARTRYVLAESRGSVWQQEAVEQLQECGVLARCIDEVLRRPASEASFLQQSLRSALRVQLTQYHYLVSSIRERRSPGLMFGDLVVAHKRVQPKLWAIHHVLRDTESAKGGELASRLQVLVQQGSHRLSSLLSDIYIEAISPLLHMTASSITRGGAPDPFNEYFIAVSPDVDDTSDTFWTSKFALRPSMLPSTVPRSLAEGILLATKNVSFIRNCCRAKQWRMNPNIVAEAEAASFASLPQVVRSALIFSNAAVLRLLREQFKLDDVLHMVNAFLLVGYSDFYELLIRKLDPILSKLSHAIQVSSVRDQVDRALLEITPYAKHLDTDRFCMLQCELVKDESKLGWDAFVLTMPLPSPLNNIFDLTARKVYGRLFRMMFKVKVAEVALKNAWRQSVVLDRVIGGLQQRGHTHQLAAWRDVAADAHLLGLQLNHFVMNLWSYLAAEVSSVAWDILTKALTKCSSFDDIRGAHNAYLAYLTQRSLLHTDCASIRMNIENVLTIVREYCGSQALLTSLIERGSGEVQSIKRQYQGLTDDYHREMSSLLTTLEEQHLKFDFLNFLLLRLNFNRFYHDTTTANNTDF